MNQQATLSRKPTNHAKGSDKSRPSRKLDSHEITLARLKRDGIPLLITTIGGNEVTGKIADFDRYSIGIRVTPESGVKYLFKSAIESFEQAV